MIDWCCTGVERELADMVKEKERVEEERERLTILLEEERKKYEDLQFRSNISQYLISQFCGSGMFIPDPGSDFFHTGSWICIKEFKYFKSKKLFLRSRKYDPGCSSRIRIPIFYPSRIKGSKRHRLPDPDPQHWYSFSCMRPGVLQPVSGSCSVADP
jgi:hypothetical protein